MTRILIDDIRKTRAKEIHTKLRRTRLFFAGENGGNSESKAVNIKNMLI